MTVRVLLADDQRLIREGIASLLGVQPGIAVVGTAENGRIAVDMARELRPDVILLDVRMPELDGVQAAFLLCEEVPASRILMLTTFDDEHYVLEALRAGASGYLLKDLPAADLAQAVRLVHAGVDQFSPAVTRRLAVALRKDDPTPVDDGVSLTDRELDVLRLVAAGSNNREIASRLYVSEGTVKNHVSSILTRLGLRDRTQAAIYAHQRRLL